MAIPSELGGAARFGSSKRGFANPASSFMTFMTNPREHLRVARFGLANPNPA
ncbi:hypothetical protein QUF72_20850 [Desulfobacterales bacterium HSG2]|nr:hypothetical protein [Desulfobacterales bacterium HSG2]